MPDFIRFHRPEEPNGYLSNWFLRDFILDGTKYSCVEQYMMSQKALLFKDYAIADRIMKTNDQQTMQDLGRQVSPYIDAEWKGRSQLIVYRGIIAKFEQNSDLLQQLCNTGDATLVECSVSDKTWGVGLSMYDDISDRRNWKGTNLLGFALMEARGELNKRLKGND